MRLMGIQLDVAKKEELSDIEESDLEDQPLVEGNMGS